MRKKTFTPQIGVTVFRIWVIILAFVGIQLSWNLRPFLCDKKEEFKLFRKYEGNFYTAIIYSLQQLSTTKEVKKSNINKLPYYYIDTIEKAASDTTYILKQFEK